MPRYSNIKDYSDRQLTDICLWLLRDGRQLARDERIGQAMEELGFQKRGNIIVARLSEALGRAQTIFDRTDGS